MDDVMIKLNSAHFGGRQRRQFKSNRGRVMPAVGHRPWVSTLQVFTPCDAWRITKDRVHDGRLRGPTEA